MWFEKFFEDVISILNPVGRELAFEIADVLSKIQIETDKVIDLFDLKLMFPSNSYELEMKTINIQKGIILTKIKLAQQLVASHNGGLNREVQRFGLKCYQAGDKTKTKRCHETL